MSGLLVIIQNITFILIFTFVTYLFLKNGLDKTSYVVFLLIILMGPLWNGSYLTILNEFNEWRSPKPNVEIYLQQIKTTTNQPWFSPYEANRIEYISECEATGNGVLILIKKIFGGERAPLFGSGLNTLGRGCDECGYYEVFFDSFGERYPESLHIEGNFKSNRFILEEVNPFLGVVPGQTHPGSNTFSFTKEKMEEKDKDRRIGTIVTKEEAEPFLVKCLVDGKDEYCSFNLLKANEFVIKRGLVHSIVLFGKQIDLPPLEKNLLKHYIFDFNSMEFIPDPSFFYLAGEGNPCY